MHVPENLSTTLTNVLEQFVEREQAGKKKYGTTVDRTDLTPEEWVKHHEEELMDAILYNRRQFHELLAIKRASEELIKRLDALMRRDYESTDQTKLVVKEALFQHKVDLTLYKNRING